MFHIAQTCSIQSVGPLKALQFTPWQTYSFRHQLNFSGKHSSHAAITREYYSLTFPPLYVAGHSVIQPSELGIVERTKMPKLRNAKGIRTWAILIASPDSTALHTRLRDAIQSCLTITGLLLQRLRYHCLPTELHPVHIVVSTADDNNKASLDGQHDGGREYLPLKLMDP